MNSKVVFGILAASLILVPNLAFANSVIVKVEPNPGPLYYQVHYLKSGEKPSYYNYQCWGCSLNDYPVIFKETGLWYWALGSP